jgi:DUF2075 family protein/DNA replication protein DnaC
MIIYSSTKENFIDDVFTNQIADKVLKFFQQNLNRTTSQNEIRSWENSLMYMSQILNDNDIPNDTSIHIEYQIPQTSKRIDFIIAGKNGNDEDVVLVIELKQWSKSESTNMDAIVRTYVGGAIREVSHPSYQAWSYTALMYDFNETVRNDNIRLIPCAYLHNYKNDGCINSEIYKEHLEKAPLFLKEDAKKFRNFIKEHIKMGDSTQIMHRIDNGKISPSKNLADNLLSLLKGNEEFVMIDEQKVVYETALHLAKSSNDKKKVLIVEGGPGTGKSVIAINLLVELTNMLMTAQYVTKNAAPRAVYEAKLKGSFKKSHISNLFSGSGAYTVSESNSYDVLIVDEAHRLNEKSGLFQNMGENQIKEIINASKFSLFFIDENQKVTLKDIGEKDEIRKWAKYYDAEVVELELESQFRCNGSDGYISWLDNTLQIRETANTTLVGIDYDFRVIDSPTELKELIFEKNKEKNSARLVAGYCWNWVSKKDRDLKDIIFPDENFAIKWNLTEDGSLWILKPDSVNEIGCIHTCQGLEIEYVGVIIGNDLIVRNGKVVTDFTARAQTDTSLKGIKTLAKKNLEQAKKLADSIIKNTYRTLMSRGSKGCYIYCTDAETNEYFKSKVC